MKILGLLVLGVFLAAGPSTRQSKNAGPAATPSVSSQPLQSGDEDTLFFQRNAQTCIAHFRVRWWGEAVGERIHPDGRIEPIKSYLKTEPTVLDFFMLAGPEQLRIAQDGRGRRIALYLKHLQLVGNHAQADVVGVANNFPFNGPDRAKVGAGNNTRREGHADAPTPQVFQIGKPVAGRTAVLGSSSYNAAMGADYHIKDQHRYEIELVEIIPLAGVMKEKPELGNAVPPAAAEEAHRDMSPEPKS